MLQWKMRNESMKNAEDLHNCRDETPPHHYPENRLPKKLPVVPRMVMQPGITVTGAGTSGLGSSSQQAAQVRVACAYQNWLDIKSQQSKATSSSGPRQLSPRERYLDNRSRHEAALSEFQRYQIAHFQVLQSERRAVSAELEAQKIMHDQSSATAVAEERSERRIRLQQYSASRAYAIDEEKARSAERMAQLQEQRKETEMFIQQSIAERKRELEHSRNMRKAEREAELAQIRERAHRERSRKLELSQKILESRAREKKNATERISAVRSRLLSAATEAKQLFETSVLARADAARHELEVWKTTRQQNAKRHEAHIKSVAQEYRNCSRRAADSFEEARLKRIEEADAVRRWKVSMDM